MRRTFQRRVRTVCSSLIHQDRPVDRAALCCVTTLQATCSSTHHHALRSSNSSALQIAYRFAASVSSSSGSTSNMSSSPSPPIATEERAVTAPSSSSSSSSFQQDKEHNNSAAATAVLRAVSAVSSSRRALERSRDDLKQSPDEVRALFLRSVQARTVGNKQLKAYIEHADPVTEWQAVEAAVDGARAGGLRPNANTNEVLLSLYIEAGRLKQALDLYALMTKERITPTTQSFNTLMKLCLDRDMANSVQTLFDDMKKRGRAPNGESYELYLSALATENPPRWEKAVEIFDKMSRTAHNTAVHGNPTAANAAGSGPVKITTKSYVALMKIYGNMQPFDWRVVYNCYFELRQKHPMVPLTWEAYHVIAAHLKKGRAGMIRRFVTYADAWFVLTHIRTKEFWFGLIAFMAAMMGLKGVLGYGVTTYKDSWDTSRKQNANSVMH